MDSQRENSNINTSDATQRRDRPAQDNENLAKPWRTEGLHESPTPPDRPRWGQILLWVLIGCFIFFLLTSVQDGFGNPSVTIRYTEFTDQVEDGNSEDIFAYRAPIE